MAERSTQQQKARSAQEQERAMAKEQEAINKANQPEEQPKGDYVVRHAAINVWDPEVELKEAKKERLTRRLLRGEHVTKDDLKHVDERKLKELLATGALVKVGDEPKPEPTRSVPAGTTSTEVPEAEGPKVPEAH